MIPSVLSHQLELGVKDFLRTTFPVSTPFFHGILDDFLEREGNLFKGPYLGVDLPFRFGGNGNEPFPEIPLGFSPYEHQAKAFERLRPTNYKSTLIATGTGSGKTESFLYPILEHCRKNIDTPGIKAILIYPMNALANDQSKRIARTIWDSKRVRHYDLRFHIQSNPQMLCKFILLCI
jgi:DEAD/DEAH box helicase domain-containing protein